MIFHVVAIREFFDQKFTIDLLFVGISENTLRDFLNYHKLIALEFYEYKKDKVEQFGKIKILLNHNGTDIRILSNAQNLESIAYGLLILGCDLKNINFVDETKLGQAEIDKIIESCKKEAKERLEHENQKLENLNKKNEDIFNDQQLEKTLLITNKLLKKIPDLIKNAENILPKEELKQLYQQGQELSKLKMGRNKEKLSEALEKTYNHFSQLEQEFQSIQNEQQAAHTSYKNENNFIVNEIQKLEKARGLRQIGGAKKGEDVFYAAFDGLGIYLKLFKRDFLSTLKEIPKNFINIFKYIDILLIFVIILCGLHITIKSASNGEINIYIYTTLIKFGIFGAIIYILNFLKKEDFIYNTILLGSGFVIGIVAIILLKLIFLF